MSRRVQSQRNLSRDCVLASAEVPSPNPLKPVETRCRVHRDGGGAKRESSRVDLCPDGNGEHAEAHQDLPGGDQLQYPSVRL